MNNKFKLTKIIATSVLFVLSFFIEFDNSKIQLAYFLITYLLIGSDVLIHAIKNIFHGTVFDENFLMSIASIGAFAIGEYQEGIAVMLLYEVGEMFQDYAVNRSRRSITGLLNIRPDHANLVRGDEVITLDPYEINIGDIILIKPGECIPLDCMVTSGNSSVDSSALTGESLPVEVGANDSILSGCINLNGLIKAKVTKNYSESTVNKILDLVENATNKKSKSENFITKFARYYTPLVVLFAALLAIVPPLITGDSFDIWLYRALVFLVVSCPCALVISVPLSFFAGIGAASRAGVLVKGSNYLEALPKTETIVFDKTGTLTKGIFAVTKTVPQGVSEDDLLEIAAYAESHSTHPISLSIIRAYGGEIANNRIGQIEEVLGKGIKAVIDDKTVLAGNDKLMDENDIQYINNQEIGTIVHIAVDKLYYGYIVIADEIKDDSKLAIKQLNGIGIKRTVMLTGDRINVAQTVAKDLGIDEVYAELLPQDKLEHLERIIDEKPAKSKVAFVGDGINDAPVIARADIGIAMGGLGSDAAIEAADIVIMSDEPHKIVSAIKIGRFTSKIVKQNIILALGVKIIILILSTFGLASMWEAVFADVGVCIIAILNAMRVLKIKP